MLTNENPQPPTPNPQPPVVTTTTLIRQSRGRTRVLRLVTIGGHCYPLAYIVEPSESMCDYCGCTDVYGCVEGCMWIDPERTICSRCFRKDMLP